MVMSKAKTVAAYLDELPEDRRSAIAKVRDVVRKHLPKGYTEEMQGMIVWAIPLKTYPDTYNGQPLCVAGLASQKNYNSLYLMAVYGDPKKEKELKEAFAKAGKKLDMGKCCVRFKKVDDLPLEAIGKIIASMPPEELIRWTEAAHPRK